MSLDEFSRVCYLSSLLLLILASMLPGTAGRRKLSSTGDVLGVQYKPPAAYAPFNPSGFNVTTALQDHAHFYSTAEMLSRWAETTFALSAHAHRQLPPQNTSTEQQTACLHDGRQCLFNPVNVGSASFPLPASDAEKVLKRFALEAHTCRRSRDAATCLMDSNCGWSDLSESCFLSHDPHGAFTSAITQCRDTLYSAINALCWRRRPNPDAWHPCGQASCRLFKAGGEDGLPEDRCMPVRTPPKLKPLDVYALMKRFYGSGMMKLMVGVGAGAGGAVPPPPPGSSSAAVPEFTADGDPALEGFGSCSTAALHYAMKTTCRQTDKETCLKDSRCGWLTGVVHGEFCVLSREAAIEALMGASAFSRTVLQMERNCAAADSASACSQVPLTITQAPAPSQ